jgi:pyruvate dehydrogenase E1 component alpha subunit
MGEKKWAEVRPSEDYFRILNPDGSVKEGAKTSVPEVSRQELLRWYEVLVETRTFEAMVLRLQRRGVLSVAASSRGEEVCGLGAAAALQVGDWLFPAYRQLSAVLYWNAPVDRIMAGLMGNTPEHIREHLPLPPELPPSVNMMPYPIFLGAYIPLAVGCALADKLNGRKHVSLAFVGEGSTSEGDFHDGLNFAGVLESPCVIIVQNNQWSISVPASRQTAAATFAQKAVAYGLPHERVDGNDIFAVYDTVKKAVDRARAGGGATLIEAVTYRVLDHNSADSSAVYRTEDEAEYWKTLDPVKRFEKYLFNEGVLDQATKTAIEERAEKRLREEIDRGRAVPPTSPDDMFLHHLQGEAGWSVKHQRDELACELAGGNPFLDMTGEGVQ